MTGTGTQADPYIVMNETDLCNMTGGVDKYYKLGADIDLSERDSNSASISIKCKELDGDGHTISNWFKKVDSSTSDNTLFTAEMYGTKEDCVFRNLNFKGFYLAGGNTHFIQVKNEGSYHFRFINCRVSIKINDTATNYSVLFHGSRLFDSELLVEGTVDCPKTILHNGASGSLIKLNLTYFNDKATELFYGTLSYCGIIGKIICKSSQGGSYQITRSETSNSYFALNFENITGFKTGSFTGVNFYDKEVMANVAEFMPAVSNLYALTTEQCKSAEYLQSIGFPCVSGDAL